MRAHVSYSPQFSVSDKERVNLVLSEGLAIKRRQLGRELNLWEILTVFICITEAHSLKL